LKRRKSETTHILRTSATNRIARLPLSRNYKKLIVAALAKHRKNVTIRDKKYKTAKVKREFGNLFKYAAN